MVAAAIVDVVASFSSFFLLLLALSLPSLARPLNAARRASARLSATGTTVDELFPLAIYLVGAFAASATRRGGSSFKLPGPAQTSLKRAHRLAGRREKHAAVESSLQQVLECRQRRATA